MKKETNQAFSQTIEHIKSIHSGKGFSFESLRIVARIYKKESFEIIYICPPDNDAIFFTWPTDFTPDVNDKPQKIVFLRFTQHGHQAPMIEFKEAVQIILKKYLRKGGLSSKFIVHTSVKDDVFSISVISREEDLNAISIYGTRIKEEGLLPPGDGDYLVQFKNDQLVFTSISA